MEIKTIIREIEQLPLSKRFFVIEETLRSIKNEELKDQATNVVGDVSEDNEHTSVLHLVSEKSLAKDWLSKEDDSWDKVL